MKGQISSTATRVSQKWRLCRPLWFRIGVAGRILWIAFSFITSRFRPVYVFDPLRIRVFILVRDLYSPLDGLVKSFQLQGIPLNLITFVDTGSTLPDCLNELQRLESLGCSWIRLEHSEQMYGPYSIWLVDRLKQVIRSQKYPYIVTDSDLEIPSSVREGWLKEMFTVLNTCKYSAKTSLPLAINDIDVSERIQIQDREIGVRDHFIYRLLSLLTLRNLPGCVACTTDTTLSLYRPGLWFSTLSIRLPVKYSIRHLPWYQSFVESSQFKYYVAKKLPLFGEWSSVVNK